MDITKGRGEGIRMVEGGGGGIRDGVKISRRFELSSERVLRVERRRNAHAH